MSRPLPSPELEASVLPYVRKEVVTLRAGRSIGEALEALRSNELPAAPAVVYLYVLDDQDRLVGVVPTRRLLMSPLQATVSSIMEARVVTISDNATVLFACELFLLHRFLALPVVDATGRLVGTLDVRLFTDEVFELAERRAVDDVFQLIGVRLAVGRPPTPWAAFRGRFPWLLANIAGGLLGAVVLGRYEAFLDARIVLALFIPVVLALAESVSIQSLTITIQGLHAYHAGFSPIARALRREFLVAALLGLSSGSVVATVAWLWRNDVGTALAVAGAIALSMLTASLLGVLLPTLARALHRDPKIAAGPLVLALADLATLLFYFHLAGILL
ncbi:MAG: magnesium transporter [Planctomycetes bacterium]|nr:magnesium transporter [Planctomycetota bacterium]